MGRRLVCGALFVTGLAGSLAALMLSDGRPVGSTLAECRQLIADSAASIDLKCLRKIYERPVAEWPPPRVAPGVSWQPLGPLPRSAPSPDDNPISDEKVSLGRRLFEDPRLSSSGQIACASCHDPQLGWGDGRSVSFGHNRQAGQRNAMNVSMSGWSSPLFWDGRVATLEEQILHPVRDPAEMAFSISGMLERLERDESYQSRFNGAFGSNGITADRVSKAVAAFLRSLSPRFNRFDRFMEGHYSALSDRQLRGLHVFRTRAGCMNCHSGPALTDNSFHNLGLHYYGRVKYEDLGRYEITGDPEDAGKFRTPSLRGVARSGPYMHNGRFHTLRGIVNMYNAGMARPKPDPERAYDPPFPETDPLVEKLDLYRTELEALTAFLTTL